MTNAIRIFLAGLFLGTSLGIAIHHLAVSAFADRSQDQTNPPPRIALPYTPTNGLLTSP